MPRPVLYYVRHGETDWNVQGRLQGCRDIALNARGRAQASPCGEILRDLFARAGRAAADLSYISSPLGRARETMERLRAPLGLAPSGYAIDPQLAEITFGAWEGFTLAELRTRDPGRVAARERDKWRFVPPGGESYEAVSWRMRDWYAGLDRDAVVAAHGGTARALIAHLGIAPAAAAPLFDVAQGVVYVIDGDKLTRHG